MPEPDTTPAATPARAPVAYGDGKGTLNTYCVACPRPEGVDIPLTVNDVDQWEQCRACGRYVVDVAREQRPSGRTETGAAIANPQATAGGAGDTGADKCTCTGTGLNPCSTCPTPWPLTPGADQAAYPDRPATLRDRLAAAILARIKRATISGPQPFGMDSMTRLLAANEYDLADVALAVRDQEMQALRGAVRTLMRAHQDCGRHGEQAASAHPPVHRWRVEHVDGDNGWVPASGMKTDRDEAVHLLNVGNTVRPLWADGTPVQRRLVRETTSYTVEATPPAPGDHGGEGQ